ncbi:54S ribosomal protein L32, mitochondrial [[Candida] anglica]|uniref:Large ribosomal subunit protein bL32m n=1 Tax=[Candida] anglica TaxID=148631 RepID=A0ABP0EKS9_9ASCO
MAASLSLKNLGLPLIGETISGLLPRVSITVNGQPISERLEELLREKLGQQETQEGSGYGSGLDIGILNAAPKKKPSYSRTRTNYLSPGTKQIKHMTNLVRCPACGHVKRSHFMCMHCFGEIKSFLKGKKKAEKGPEIVPQSNLDPIDEAIIYPGKRISAFEEKVRAKEWVPQREEPLMFNAENIAKKTKKDYLK